MNGTTAPASDQQATRRYRPDLDPLVAGIQVGGNVDGTLLVGDENIVGSHNVVYKVNTGHGAVVNIAEAPPAVRPRTLRGQPLVPPLHFTGRESDLGQIADSIRANQRVLLYGPDGIGKSALLARASAGEAARAKRDGLVFVEGIDEEGQILGLSDIIQRLFDSLFESNPPLKVTYPTARTHLSNAEALIILDHLQLPMTTVERLPALFSGGAALLVASREAPVDDVFLPFPVQRLKRAESIQLLSSKAGIQMDETRRVLLDQICDLLADVPLAIAKTANAIRLNRWELKTVADALARIQPPSGDPVQAAIERSVGLIYSRLDPPQRKMLVLAAAAFGKSVDRPWLERVAGGAAASEALVSLELLRTNSPRLGVPDGIRQVLQPGVRDVRDHRDTLLRHLLEEFKPTKELDFERVAAELGNLLGSLQWAADEGRWWDVIALARAVDPYLTLHGLWDAWEAVMQQVLLAAQNVDDPFAHSWALHQLGTRAIGVGSRLEAISFLQRALTMRLAQGDRVGVAYTLHNLRLLFPTDGREVDETGEGKPDSSPDSTFWEKISRIRGNNVGWLAGGLILLTAIAAAALQPSLGLRIQASPPTYSPVGQAIEYSYIVDNPGLRPLAGPIVVTTADESEVTCPDLDTIGDGDNFLDWNETFTCTGFHTIDEADAENGSLTNTAMASAGDSGVQATQSITLRRDDRYVLLDIETDPATYRDAGETITVAYLVSNAGNEPLGGMIGVTGNSLPVNCPEAGQAGDGDTLLESGENLACTATYTITEEDVRAGAWTNTAAVRIGDFESYPQTVTVYRMAPPQLALRRSASPATYREAGQVIEYVYEVANRGMIALHGPVTVSDDRLDVTCPEQDDLLEPGETIVCNARYTITEEDLEIGSITTRAAAATEELTSELQSLTIEYMLPRTDSPLQLMKSAHPATYQTVGQEIRYTYEITNHGERPLRGLVVVFDNKVQVTCAEQDSVLDPGETLTCSAGYTITEADIHNGSVTNAAVAAAGDSRSPVQITTVRYEMPLPVLFKSAEPRTYEHAGQEIRYTYVVTNPGASPMNGSISVKDDLTEVGCSPLNLRRLAGAALSPGESFTCTGTYTITEADMRDESVTNTAWAAVGDLYSEPKSVTIFREPVPPAILRLHKSAEPNVYREAGEEITYAYFITNAGKGPARGPLTVEDDRIEVRCPAIDAIGDLDEVLDPGEWLTCRGSYTITEEDIRNGSVTNTASAQAGRVSSNPSSETIYARALRLTAAADPESYGEAGIVIQYRYEVTSQSVLPFFGPVTVTSEPIEVDCPGLNATGNQDELFDRDESMICTGSYPVTQADIDTIPDGSDRGSVTTTASASAGETTSNEVTVTVQGPLPRPELTLTNTAAPDRYTDVGEAITYTYAVTNSGNVTLPAPVEISDDHIRDREPFACGNHPQGLAPQEQVGCTETYTIRQEDFDSDSVTNSAIAATVYGEERIESQPATATVTCNPRTDWMLYTVESGVSLSVIDAWYAETMSDLQRANCMGASDTVEGQSLLVPGPPPPARISGVIRDTAGQPVAGIPVQLMSGGIVIDRTTTDANGRYTLSARDPGTYQIFRQTVFLRQRGDNLPYNFQIVPAGQ